MYWLDYSAGTLSAATIKAAGYDGVIRYVTAPRLMNPPGRNPKHTTKAEFDDHRRNGLKQLLVFQGGTTDADGGYSLGQANARLALEGANYLGYSGLIFFTNDRPDLPSSQSWDDYLTGAASVLGWNRVGAYGFANALDVAVNQTNASAFWAAGRKSDAEKRPYVNFWQDNNTQVTVGGILCDRNLPMKPMGTETDMPLNDADKTIIYEVLKKYNIERGDWWYGPRFRGGDNYATVVHAIAADAAAAKVDAAAAKADLATVKGALAALDAKVSGGGVSVPELAEEVAALLGPALAAANAEELKKRLAE